MGRKLYLAYVRWQHYFQGAFYKVCREGYLFKEQEERGSLSHSRTGRRQLRWWKLSQTRVRFTSSHAWESLNCCMIEESKNCCIIVWLISHNTFDQHNDCLKSPRGARDSRGANSPAKWNPVQLYCILTIYLNPCTECYTNLKWTCIVRVW